MRAMQCLSGGQLKCGACNFHRRVLCDFDMTSIRENHTPTTTMRYSPQYAVGNKSGRPKKDKRMKSCLDGNTPKRKAAIAETIESEQKKKKSRKSKSDGKQLGNVSLG